MAALPGLFTLFCLITTKAVALTYFSLIKTPALFQELYLMDAAPSRERLMVERIGRRYSSIRRSKELPFHSQPVALRRAQADESHTALTVGSPGPTKPVGPPPISTMFSSPAMRCEGSQLVTAARLSGQPMAANRGRHQRPHQHPVLPQQLLRSRHRALLRRPGLVPRHRPGHLILLGCGMTVEI